MILTADQIKTYALQAGFTGPAADTITAISIAESGGNPNAYNPSDPNGGSYGLTQINGIHSGAASALGDPLQAMQLAFQVSNGGTNFNPWSVYTNGSYAQYLGNAGAAAADPLGTFSTDPTAGITTQPTTSYVPQCTGILDFFTTNCSNQPNSVPADPTTSTQSSGGTASTTAGSTSAISSIGSFFKTLTSADLWQRIGIVGIGIIILLAALFLFGFANLTPLRERSA